LFVNNLTTGELKSILKGTDNFKPYALSLSTNEEKLAVVGFNQDLESTVKIITIKNHEQETIKLLQPNVYSINWHPNNHYLLLSDGRQLLQMSLNGQLTKINFENFSYILTPSFNQRGDAITLTLKNIDSDILISALNSPNVINKIIDSNTIDFAPNLSPDGEKLVFISERKGYPQLFLYDIDAQKSQLLYKNSKRQLYLAPPIWHPTKDLIASAINDKLIIIKLSKDAVSITETEKIVGSPQQWFTDENALLIMNYSTEKQILAKYYLDSKELHPLIASSNSHGYLNSNNEIILISSNKIAKLQRNNEPMSANEEVLIDVDGKIINSVIKGDILYLHIKSKSTSSLWTFSLLNLVLKKEYDLPQNIETIWDLNIEKNILLMETMTIEKDIIQLENNNTEQ